MLNFTAMPNYKSPAQQEKDILNISRKELIRRIEAQIGKGKELLDIPVSTKTSQKGAWGKYNVWDKSNKRMIKNAYASADIEKDYSDEWSDNSGGEYSPFSYNEEQDFHNQIRNKLRKLKTLKSHLPEPAAAV